MDIATHNNAQQRLAADKTLQKGCTVICDTFRQPRLLIIVIFLGLLSLDLASAALAGPFLFIIMHNISPIEHLTGTSKIYPYL